MYEHGSLKVFHLSTPLISVYLYQILTTSQQYIVSYVRKHKEPSVAMGTTKVVRKVLEIVAKESPGLAALGCLLHLEDSIGIEQVAIWSMAIPQAHQYPLRLPRKPMLFTAPGAHVLQQPLAFHLYSSIRLGWLAGWLAGRADLVTGI